MQTVSHSRNDLLKRQVLKGAKMCKVKELLKEAITRQNIAGSVKLVDYVNHGSINIEASGTEIDGNDLKAYLCYMYLKGVKDGTLNVPNIKKNLKLHIAKAGA